jgi:hypothetical protein
MGKSHLLIVILILFDACMQTTQDVEGQIVRKKPIEGSRIAWNFSSLQKLVPFEGRAIGFSSYPRMIELSNGNFMCVYEIDGQIEYIVSTDKGITWHDPVLIGPIRNGIYRAVPEILQLDNDRIIVTYNLRPPMGNNDKDKRFGIAIVMSDNYGKSWTNEKILFEASYRSTEGCWEPCILQLPDGELQLFFANEAPFETTHEQNISFLRSFDNGITWGSVEVASFSETSRDGMPVPLFLDETNEIVVAIEDNFKFNFKPAIIRTNDNWASGFVGRDERRTYALSHNVNSPVYQGAPYIRKLPSGNVVLSYQGTEDRGNTHDITNSAMYVETGSTNADNFKNKTEPFNIPYEKSALWNSISIADGKVWALTATNGFSGDLQEVWIINGYEINQCYLPKKAIKIDGEIDDFLKNESPQFFVGHQGESHLKLNLTYDDDYIYVSAQVRDQTPNKNDGIILCFDISDISSTLPVKGVYKLSLNLNQSHKAKEGHLGRWVSADIKPQSFIAKINNDGYVIEASYAWSDLGGKPLFGGRIGIHVGLIEDRTGSFISYTEDLVLASRMKPYTWVSVYLE